MNNGHKKTLRKDFRDGHGSRSAPKVLERLRHLILEGEYGPKKRLIEEQLAEKLGVSRTPVRQALTMLDVEGLVEIAPNKGAMVCSFGIEEVRDVYDLRAVLEGYAARRAASHIGEAELERLGRLCEEMEGLGSHFSDHEGGIQRLVSLNQEYHGTIVDAGRNRRLGRLVRHAVEVPLVFKTFFWHTPHERTISNHHHRQILKALEAGDADRAEIVMREHIYEGRDFVMRVLEEETDG